MTKIELLREIISKIGNDVVQGVGIEDPDIVTNVINPVLREYFSKFPFIKIKDCSVDSQSVRVVNFSDIDDVDSGTGEVLRKCFGVINYTFKAAGSGTGGGNIFNLVKTVTGYGSRGILGRWDIAIDSITTAEAIKTYSTANTVFVDRYNKLVRMVSNIPGIFSIKFALYSMNIDDVPFEDLDDVLTMMKVKLAELVDIRASIVEIPSGIHISLDQLRDWYKEEKEKIEAKWNGYVAPILLWSN